MKWLLLLVFTLFLVFVMLFASDPLNRAPLFNAQGTLESGDFPYVKQGDMFTDVRSRLLGAGLVEQDFAALEIERCANHVNPSADSVYIFLDRSWRRGVVCLFTEDGKVIDAAWSFNPIAP